MCYVIATPHKLQFVCHPGGHAQLRGVALDLERKCVEKAAVAFAWSLLSGVTSEQFRGG